MEPEPPQKEPLLERSERVIFGNAINFHRARDASEFQNYYERPLLVEAWAQTTREDFDLADDCYRRNIELQKEVGALRERIRQLEEDLDIRQRLLEQIHVTAAFKSVISRSEAEYAAPAPTPPVTPIVQQHNLNLHHHVGKRISPIARESHACGPQILSHMKHESQHITADNDRFQYTIVSNATDSGAADCEPIEIQLAEEDGALNLNSSADSGRLEICLSTTDERHEQNLNEFNEDKQGFVKEERQILKSPPVPHMPAQSGMLIKRRKLDANDVSRLQESQQYYHNGYGRESSPKPSSVICHSISNELTTSTSEVIKSHRSSRSSSDRTTSTTTITSTPSVILHHNDQNVMVSIGPNNTRVPLKVYESMNWDSPSIATRKLLMAVFDRQTLATHSMTGKPSPAFKGQAKPQKKRLDPKITEDIVYVVTRRCRVSDKEVRNAITTKCADENKMMKQQIKKNRNLFESNKENYTT